MSNPRPTLTTNPKSWFAFHPAFISNFTLFKQITSTKNIITQ